MRQCDQCSKEFSIANWEIKDGRRFCSKECYWIYRKKAKMLPPSQKGKVPWNKGMKCKAPATAYKPGHVSWLKGKQRLDMRGDKHPRWKGGTVKHPDKRIRKSAEYIEWRNTVFKRDDYTCQECRVRGVELNADHIKPFAKFPELRLDINNGRTLCILCHRKTDTYGGKSLSKKHGQ